MRCCRPVASKSLLKRRTSSLTLCFGSSPSAERRRRSASFRGPNIGIQWVLNRACTDDEEEHFTQTLPGPLLCAKCCAVCLTWCIFLFGWSLQIIYRDAAVMRNQPINLAFCHRRHCRGWTTTEGLLPTPFSPLLKRRSQRLTELISTASSTYTLLRCLWICIGLEPSAVSSSINILCLVFTSTTSAIVLLLYWKQFTYCSTDDLT